MLLVLHCHLFSFKSPEGCDRNTWEFHVVLHQPANSAPLLVRSKKTTFSRRNETTVELFKHLCLCWSLRRSFLDSSRGVTWFPSNVKQLFSPKCVKTVSSLWKHVVNKSSAYNTASSVLSTGLRSNPECCGYCTTIS